MNKTIEAISIAYTNLTYDEFCKVIGEPSSYGSHELTVENTYALEKWSTFHRLAAAINKLGTQNLESIINYGESHRD